MTYKQVSSVISSIGIPYAYYQFPDGTGQACPFICFFFTADSDMKADDTNYQRIRELAIELYTDNKDFTLEETVERALNDNGFVFAREESYLDSEKMYMVTYTTQIVITGEVNNV